MATTITPAYAHITKRPGICGGKAVIDDTRVRVHNVACIVKDGGTVDDVLEAYPQLSLAQVHAALAYYYDNRDEIEAELDANERIEEIADEINALYRPKPPGQ